VITNIYDEKIGLLIVVRDVSKIKEEQLKLINQEKLALLGQMGATIIHETRNFLTTIKGNSQLIELYVDNDKVKQHARKINSDTDEVNRIISDFLNLSKPRDTELEEVAFNDLILSMKDTIETSSLINKVQVVLNLDYDERYILCDETQIRQVVLNICKNAVESMEETLNPVLSIITGLNEYSKEVFIKISDNGKGIDNETIKKIGTPFFTTKKTGTGLGLNACYQIIMEHKGRIDIESEPGKGTTFTITIPYIEEELEEII
jgi:signal transduction histidine kinase